MMYYLPAQSRVALESGRLSCCELSGESVSLITVDCSALVSDLRRRREPGENFDSIITDLEYGVDAELEEFARRLLVLLTDAMEGTMNTIDNGLSASSQQANSFL